MAYSRAENPEDGRPGDAGLQTSRNLDRDAASDLWRRTLSRIPTRFGRLVYLSGLRELNTGAYEHHGLAQSFGTEEADRTLRASHEQTFAEWLNLGLEKQKMDLDEYLDELKEDTGRIVANWARLAPYRDLIPANARDVERKLYVTDLEVLVNLLMNEHGVAWPDRDA
ncbi:MAG: hypothetical protein WD696_14320 [Bryobacteraceae bacterium]